jgi:aldose 1-epimerase
MACAFAPARVFTLQNSAGLTVKVMDYGATLLSCSLPMSDGTRREVALGCNNLVGYQQQRVYLGAAIGRFTNRLREARIVVDGEAHQLAANKGVHQLHGGPSGFDQRTWSVARQNAHAVVFQLVSPDGDQGFPGEVTAKLTYELGDDLSLDIRFEARTTKACPVGLTQHTYFNLDGDSGKNTISCLGHTLRLASSHYLPVDAEGLPSSDFVSVARTSFDLREPRLLSSLIEADPTLRQQGGLDHCYALDPSCGDCGHSAALLTSSDQRVTLHLATDQPALQVYTGQYLSGTPSRDGGDGGDGGDSGVGGAYGAHAGIALEPQFALDSPNRMVSEPFWPDSVLRPGETWRRRSFMRFIVT